MVIRKEAINDNGRIEGEVAATFYTTGFSRILSSRVCTACESPFKHSVKYCSSFCGVNPNTSTLDETSGWSSAEDDGRDVTIKADSCSGLSRDISGRISLLMMESLGRSEGSSSHPSSTHSTPLPYSDFFTASVSLTTAVSMQGSMSAIFFASLTRDLSVSRGLQYRILGTVFLLPTPDRCVEQGCFCQSLELLQSTQSFVYF